MQNMLQCYRTLCRVAERGSLTRAARDLGLAQASVSRHLQELERRYGATLLQRTTRRVALTAAGERLFEYAQALISSEAQLADQLRAEQEVVEGPLVVAASTAFGHHVASPFCAAFMARYPGVRLRLTLHTRRSNLVEEGIDVAIRIGRLQDSSLVATRLGELDEVLVAAPSVFPRGRVPEDPEDLVPYPRLGLADADLRPLHNGRKRHTLDAPLRFATDSFLALRHALLCGLGYGSIQRYLVADELARGQLIEVLPRWTQPPSPISAVLPGRHSALRVRRFVEEFAEALSRQGMGLPVRGRGQAS
jgi:DNA-binding transcriptional LysR family regulator